MMITKQFGLQDHIDLLLARSAPASSTYQAPAGEQKNSLTRTDFMRCLGVTNRTAVPLNAQLIKVNHKPAYWEEHLVLDAGEQAQIPVVVLVPKGPPPFKPILVFHGHEPGVDYVLGHYPDEETAAANLAIDNNYAQALAEAGYLVCVVEQRGLGRRLTNQVEDRGYPCSCRHLSFSYLLLGRTLVGERCWDGQRALDYLQTRSDVVPGIVGCTGHSGGGCTALWLSAMDERITAVVVSGYFCSFQASILAMPHCECNYMPGILELGEMGDIAGLLAPRPLCVVNGRNDPIFPIQGAVKQFETVKKAYAANGRAQACQLAIHPGAHAYHLPSALTWFDRWLAV